MSTQGYSTGKLFHTRDGGLTWEAYDTPFGYIDASFIPLIFLDEKQGWTGGLQECSQTISRNCPFPLYETRDGGRTWLAPKTISFPQDLLDRVSTTYIAFTIRNPNTLLAAPGQVIPGWPLSLYLTRDAARTWQAVPVPGPLPGAGHLGAVGGQPGEENPRLNPPVFLTDQEGFFSVLTQPGGQNELYVYRTEDGGSTWTPVSDPVSLPGRVFVKFPQFTTRMDWYVPCADVQSSLIAFCVTHDGGGTWQVIQPDVPVYDGRFPDLAAFQFLDGQTGWAAVGASTFYGEFFYSQYHTRDGGSHWMMLKPTLTVLNPVPSLTPLPTAGLSGLSGQLSSTGTPAPVNPSGFPSLRSMHWVDLQHAWALTQYSNDPSDSNRLLASSDGGGTWLDVTPPVTDTRGLSFDFLDADTAWGALSHPDPFASKDILYRTTDGGQTWESFKAPFAEGSLHFFDRLHGWAVDHHQGVGAGNAWVGLFRTEDGGQSWTQLMPPPGLGGGEAGWPPGTFHIASSEGFSFQDPSTLWLGGGYIYDHALGLLFSRDAGGTWGSQRLELPGDLGYLDASAPIFLNSNDGFFSVKIQQSASPADAGIWTGLLIFATQDGGQSWAARPQVGGVKNPRVDFVTPQDWFIYLADQLLVTHDGGQTWQAQTFPSTPYGDCRPHFIDSQHGWALVGDLTGGTGESNVLYRTVDGGKTCQSVNPVLK